MATQKQLIEQLIIEIENMKTKMPNGELKAIQKSLKDIESSQCGIKDDVRAIQKRLFNPDDGLIVQTNKNTESRRIEEAKAPEYANIIDDFKRVLTWKAGVERGLWMVYSAVIGIIIKLLFWS
mgnify:CR=1 FL=1|jgi:hypothetical protein|tara:strand:+ start:410 stop:778 length:369 start_codon:yes stop_codon:yes gene_type:complete